MVYTKTCIMSKWVKKKRRLKSSCFITFLKNHLTFSVSNSHKQFFCLPFSSFLRPFLSLFFLFFRTLTFFFNCTYEPKKLLFPKLHNLITNKIFRRRAISHVEVRIQIRTGNGEILQLKFYLNSSKFPFNMSVNYCDSLI